MKLETNDKSMLFEFTNIPDLFFTDYLSNANGNYTKVYLYMLFLSKYNKEIKLADLSKKLALPIDIVKESLKYWEEQELIIAKPTGYILNSIQQIHLNKVYNPRTALTKEQIEKSEKLQYREKSIEEINNSCFQGLMSTVWRDSIYLWFEKYGFDEHVMIALFQYCYSKASGLNVNYVATVADAWSKNNVKTYTDLENFYEKDEKMHEIKKSIAKKLGLRRNLGQFEETYVHKWIHDFEYNMEIIDIALKKIASKSDVGFAYIDKIISDWHDRNLKTATDIQNFIANSKVTEKNKKELVKKTNYNNYEQRQYDNLDNFYDNLNPKIS